MEGTHKPTEQINPPKKKEVQSSLWGWVRFIAFLAAIIFFFKLCIGITIVSGHSMSPTIEDGDILISNHLLYEVEQGDIILFRDPHGYDVIKRVIALPGDTVSFKDGLAIVNGMPLIEDYTKGLSVDTEEVVVPEGSYFVVGDSRDIGESLDSRDESIGPIDESTVKGKIFMSLLPFEWF